MSRHAMPIDTQQVVDTLTNAGVPLQQAKAHASVLDDALHDYEDQHCSQLCTKQDLTTALAPLHGKLSSLDSEIVVVNAKIDAAVTRLDARIDTVEARMTAKIADTKTDLVLWIVSAGIFQTGLFTALLLKVAT